VCRTALHRVEQCPVKGPHVLFCKWLDNPHRECFDLLTGWLDRLYILLGWDDDCSGLVEMLVREAEWKDREAHNDAEAAHWESEAPDG
jgi:hypothetical protein